MLAIECAIAPGPDVSLGRPMPWLASFATAPAFWLVASLSRRLISHLVFRLTFPKWVDVSQSRDSFRCPAPPGCFLHLSASNPRRILNALSDYAILMARSSEIHLGKLRIVHLTPVGGHAVVGCAIVTNARSSLDAVAMYAQRRMRRVSSSWPCSATRINGCACLAVLRQTVPIHKCRVGLFHRRGLRPAPCLQTHQTSSFAAPGWPPSR
jgi:hypothetical protein